MSRRSKEAIKHLRALKKDWDSYGAKPFLKNLCELIEIIIEEAEDIGLGWDLDPNSNGSVALIFKESE